MKISGRKASTIFFTVLALILGSVGAGGLATAAAAQTDFTYPGAISNITLERTRGQTPSVQQWEELRINADWNIPDGAVAGETFGMTLPVELQRAAGNSFEVRNEAGDLVANCTVSAPTAANGGEVVCMLTDFVNGKEDLKGKLWLTTQTTRTTDENTLTFITEGEVEVAIPGAGGIVPAPAETRTNKSGGVNAANPNVVDWILVIPASTLGDSDTLTISDVLTRGNTEYEDHQLLGTAEGGQFSVRSRTVANGEYVDTYQPLPRSRYTHDFPTQTGGHDFTLTINGIQEAGPNVVYQVRYRTIVSGKLINGDKYQNVANINGTNVTGQVIRRASGGGIGDGTAYTRFNVLKQVAGDGNDRVPADTEFTVHYVVGNETRDMTVLNDGVAVNSERFRVGSTFTISEINLPTVDGVNWGDYRLEGIGLTDNGDGTYSLTPANNTPVALVLTNTAEEIGH